MLFSHDTEHSLACVVELVNSSPGTAGEELLPDVAALEQFVARHEVSELGVIDARDLVAVHELRELIRPVFAAPDDRTAATLVNGLVGRAAMTPRLTHHDGYSWHIHYHSPGAALAEHLAVDGGMALAQVIATGERERLRVCEAPDCEQVLVDLSRNRSKRYCDARTCGNRLHVAAYRERQKAAGA